MLFNVQVLRAIAATMVVWVHTQELIISDVVPHWARNFGYGGVDLFFVISGFIMVCATQNKDVDPVTFYRKRIRRVVPLYYFFTVFVLITSIFAPASLKITNPELMQTIKSMLFIPFEKTPDRVYPIYYLGWTLNYEMFFYSAFAASLLLPKRIRPTAIAAVMISLVILGSPMENISDYGVAAFFYTRPILLDFVLGVLVASYFQIPARTSKTHLWWICLAVGTVWLALGGQVFSFGSAISPPTDTFVRFGAPSGLIVAGAVGLEQSGIKIGSTLMRRSGDASYSIYLSHYFFVGAVIALAVRMELDDASRALLAPVTIAAAIALGFATYYLIERPFAGDFNFYRSLLRLLHLPHRRSSIRPFPAESKAPKPP